MKTPPGQKENLAWRIGDLIHLRCCEKEWTIPEARRLVREIKDAMQRCNVAIFSPANDLFKTADDGSVFTTFLNDGEELEAARSAFNIERTSAILPVVAAIMDFHSNQDALNIVISEEVMQYNAKSYLTFTGQFCSLLGKQTQEFLSIKAIYDRDRKQFGIFCRKSEFEMSTTFRGQLLAELKEKHTATILKELIPETYVLYSSTLVHFLRKRLPEYEVELVKDTDFFTFSIKNKS